MTAIAVVGTGTGVGKTRVTTLLVKGLRALGHRTWVHKPVACGGWEGTAAMGSADDGRALAALCADGQESLSVCPFQFPEACSPHLAAAAAGALLTLERLLANLRLVVAGVGDGGAAVVETAGGLLSPITARRESNADLIAAAGLPVVVVARRDLGTLNHTALTVAELRRRGIRILGLVVNEPEPAGESVATRTAVRELALLTGLAVLADLPHGQPSRGGDRALAALVLDAHARPA